jgi:hypothetical protein
MVRVSSRWSPPVRAATARALPPVMGHPDLTGYTYWVHGPTQPRNKLFSRPFCAPPTRNLPFRSAPASWSASPQAPP